MKQAEQIGRVDVKVSRVRAKKLLRPRVKNLYFLQALGVNDLRKRHRQRPTHSTSNGVGLSGIDLTEFKRIFEEMAQGFAIMKQMNEQLADRSSPSTIPSRVGLKVLRAIRSQGE